MPADALEPALDELYGADAADFVATRKRLAGELRTAGDKDAAKQLLAARRPSTSAWALNQLARRDPDVLETLLDRSAELRAAQTRALSGQSDALRGAMRSHRDALDAATDSALAVLGDRATDAFRSEIISTLRAASADEEVGETLRVGRIVREVSASGFPEVAGLTLVPDLIEHRSRPKATESDSSAARDDAPVEAERAAETEPGTKREVAARSERERAAAAKAEKEREAAARAEREREAKRTADLEARDAALAAAAAADVEASRAQEHIDSIQRELESAKETLREARTRSRTATHEAARLTTALGTDSVR
jgi:hypothetical protein